MYWVGASQTLVLKSRRDALRRAAELDVERLQHEYDSRRAEVEREVRTAYIEAAAAQNQVDSTADIATLLKSIADASRARYETGAVPQSDLIRAMLETSNVQHELIALKRQRNAAVARLLPLLNLPPTTSVPAFSLHQPMEMQDERPFDATLPHTTPAIAALETETARADEAIRLAKLATRPDVSVEASYGFRPEQKDMFSVTGRVELPIRKATLIEPRIREAIAQRDAARQQIESLRQQLLQDLGSELVLHDEAVEQIDLHMKTLVPQAKVGFESALAAYQSGKTSFDAVLESLRTYVALNVDFYDFLRQKMLAEVDITAIRAGARSGMLASPATPMMPPRPMTNTASTSMQ
jgi:outer membrane protein TolC